jgi:hypothetical protein
MQPGIPVIRRYDGRDRDVAQSDTVRRDPAGRADPQDGETVRIEATQSTPRTAGTLPASWSVAAPDVDAAAPDVDAAAPDVDAAAPDVDVAAGEVDVAAGEVDVADAVGEADAISGAGAADRVRGWLRAGRDRLADMSALGTAVRAATAERFRLPAGNEPAPQTGRMLGVCAWATLLGFVGVGIALRALVALLAGDAPGWFEPTITTVGMLGIALTTAAFTAVHRARLPWALLGTATVLLGVAFGANVVAL